MLTGEHIQRVHAHQGQACQQHRQCVIELSVTFAVYYQSQGMWLEKRLQAAVVLLRRALACICL